LKATNSDIAIRKYPIVPTPFFNDEKMSVHFKILKMVQQS